MRKDNKRTIQAVTAVLLAITLAVSPVTGSWIGSLDKAFALTESASCNSSSAAFPVDTSDENLSSSDDSASVDAAAGTGSSEGIDNADEKDSGDTGSSDSSDSQDGTGDSSNTGNDSENIDPEPEPEPEPLKPRKVKATGTTDAAIEFARQYSGLKGLKNVKERMKFHRYNMWYPGFNSQWCAWFVTNCGYMTGSSGRFGASVAVNSLAYSTVNSKGARITFVNYKFYKAKRYSFVSSRRSYNKEYKPRKGDIIIISKDGKYWWSHVGLVTAAHDNPKKDVPTIEGNTGSMNYKKAVVEEKLRTSRKGARIVAYITPKYKKSK